VSRALLVMSRSLLLLLPRYRPYHRSLRAVAVRLP
jgi:hypothetical protein